MSGSNFYEEAATQAAKEIRAMLPDMAEEVRGGSRPPWTVELAGPKLKEYWDGLPIQQKMSRWTQMTPDEQAEIKRATGY